MFGEWRNKGGVKDFCHLRSIAHSFSIDEEFQQFFVEFSLLWMIPGNFCCVLQQRKQSQVKWLPLQRLNYDMEWLNEYLFQGSSCLLLEKLNMGKKFSLLSRVTHLIAVTVFSERECQIVSLLFCFLWELRSYCFKDLLPWGTLHAVAQQATIIKWLQAKGRHYSYKHFHFCVCLILSLICLVY